VLRSIVDGVSATSTESTCCFLVRRERERDDLDLAVFAAYTIACNLAHSIDRTILDKEREIGPKVEVGNDVERFGLSAVDLPLDKSTDDQVYRNQTDDTGSQHDTSINQSINQSITHSLTHSLVQ
jgi:hypothetical protein